MKRKWESEAQSLAFQNKPLPIVVGILLKRELIARLPWVVGGLLFSFPVTVAAGYLVSFVAYDYRQAFVLSYVPALLGLGTIGTQIVFLHEGIHHTVYKPTEWLPRMRKWLPILAFAIFTYPLFVFLPVENPLYIWKHPVLKVTDTLLATFLGITSPYLAKIGYDYFQLTPEQERSVWKVSLVLIAIYYLFVTATILLLFPHIPLSDLGLQLSLVVISLLGVLYAVKWNLRGQRKGQSPAGEPDVHGAIYHYILTVRDSRV
jgi:MFS family permease